MKKLIDLLKDGNSRTIENLAAELGTTPADINRQLEYLEHIGAVRRESLSADTQCKSCHDCGSSGCAAACKGCIPQNAAADMGGIWVVTGSF